jgi:hypothetical protein
MQEGAAKLAAMLFVGFLLLVIGITGKWGSLLGAFIDPANMKEGNGSSGNAASTADGSNFPNYSNSVATTAQMSLMISSVFGAYGSQAAKIATCESSLNPNKVNPVKVGGSQAIGLFQILYPSTWNTTTFANDNPKDPITNIKAAYEIFKRDGYSWREWDCAKKVGL